jgi:hypothetical protein
MVYTSFLLENPRYGDAKKFLHIVCCILPVFTHFLAGFDGLYKKSLLFRFPFIGVEGNRKITKNQ